MGADIYVYCPSEGDGLCRSDLEDLLEGFFGDAAEMTGGGGGRDGFNLDFQLNDDEPLEQWVVQLRAFLQQTGVRPGTVFDVFEPGWEPGMEWREVEVFGRDRRITERDPKK